MIRDSNAKSMVLVSLLLCVFGCAERNQTAEPAVYGDFDVEFLDRCDAPPRWARDDEPLPPGITEEDRIRTRKESFAEWYEFKNVGDSNLKDVKVAITYVCKDGVEIKEEKSWADWPAADHQTARLDPDRKYRIHKQISLDGTATVDDKKVLIRAKFTSSNGFKWVREEILATR